MLDERGGVTDDAGDQDLSNPVDPFPITPLMFMPHIGGLDEIAARIDSQEQVDDILQRQVVRVRVVPVAPTQMIPHPVLRKTAQGVVEDVDAKRCEFAILVQSDPRTDTFPQGGDIVASISTISSGVTRSGASERDRKKRLGSLSDRTLTWPKASTTPLSARIWFAVTSFARVAAIGKTKFAIECPR